MPDFELIQIDENSWRIEAGMVRAYLFAGTNKAMLVDSTATNAPLYDLVKTVTDLPVMLVNTHADPDHIACNEQFEAAYMHPAEYALYNKSKKKDDAPARPLWNGDIIDLGGRTFEVIHIPGHTCGSIALLDREKRVLISGDSISANPIFIFGPFRDISALQLSLELLKKRSADFDSIYTSHGEYEVGTEQIDKILECSKELMAGHLTAEEPPFPLPAKMYRYNGAGFYFDPAEF